MNGEEEDFDFGSDKELKKKIELVIDMLHVILMEMIAWNRHAV